MEQDSEDENKVHKFIVYMYSNEKIVQHNVNPFILLKIKNEIYPKLSQTALHYLTCSSNKSGLTMCLVVKSAKKQSFTGGNLWSSHQDFCLEICHLTNFRSAYIKL